MDERYVATLITPTGFYGTTTTANSEKRFTEDSTASEEERNGCMDSVTYSSPEPLSLTFQRDWFPPDYSASPQVRIVEVLTDGIYRVEWMTTSFGSGLTGHSVKEPAL